jgi:transcriptional regulator with XRE-family HTH domain
MANWHDRKKNEVRQRYGLTVRRHRHALNLSQHQLAELAGISSSYLGDIERGLRNVALENILALAEALQCYSLDLRTCEYLTNAEIKMKQPTPPKDIIVKFENFPVDVSFVGRLPRIIYRPENEIAKTLTILMRKQNFSRADIEKMRELGFVVNVKEHSAISIVPEDLR